MLPHISGWMLMYVCMVCCVFLAIVIWGSILSSHSSNYKKILLLLNYPVQEDLAQ